MGKRTGIHEFLTISKSVISAYREKPRLPKYKQKGIARSKVLFFNTLAVICFDASSSSGFMSTWD